MNLRAWMGLLDLPVGLRKASVNLRKFFGSVDLRAFCGNLHTPNRHFFSILPSMLQTIQFQVGIRHPHPKDS